MNGRTTGAGPEVSVAVTLSPAVGLDLGVRTPLGRRDTPASADAPPQQSARGRLPSQSSSSCGRGHHAPANMVKACDIRSIIEATVFNAAAKSAVCLTAAAICLFALVI
jgi:hypothetical protein